MHRIAAVLVALTALVFGPTPADAQSYPTKRVTLIVPFAPGGPTDVVGRLVGQSLEQRWNQPFIIDNRPGASGIVGTEVMSRAAPDGYTLLFSGVTPWSAPLFVKNVPFSPDDFRIVAKLAGSQYLLVTSPETAAKTLGEFVALAKSRPGQLNYATLPYTTYDLDYELFLRMLGARLQKVPYNSAVNATQAVLRNEAQFYFAVPGSVKSMVEEGRLVPLAMMAGVRTAGFPAVPTARELGFDFQSGFGFGIVVLAKTPEPVARKLGADIAATLKEPAVAGKLRAMGYDVPEQPLAWSADVKKEIDRYVKVAKEINLQPQ